MISGAGPTLGLALLLGVAAQIFARHARIPGIVLLLVTGVVVGPDVLDVIDPVSLGNGLEILVGMAVAVILFEGGLNLDLHRLRREALTIRRLITIGAALTALGGMLAARFFMGWDWVPSALFGTLVIVTGPTVINPLLRRVRVKRSLHTILEAEGVLIDPIGAIVAIVALEVVLAGSRDEAALGLLQMPASLVAGGLVGLVAGGTISLLLKRRGLIPENLQNIFSLTVILAAFELSEFWVAESGIMASVVAGFVVGNLGTPIKDDLRDFKEQLTIMLIGVLFVLLAADVRLEDVVALGLPGLLTIAALMFVVRPIVVAVSGVGSSLTFRECAFLSWLSPRGIVAAAVASIFAQRLSAAGFEYGPELRALVFLVIAVTVVVQGILASPIATLLRVRQRGREGYVVIGGNAVGRKIGQALSESGEPVTLVDSNPDIARECEEAGFTTVCGTSVEESILIQAEVPRCRGAVAVTPNQAVNLLTADRVHELDNAIPVHVAVTRISRSVSPSLVASAGHHLLFGREVALASWIAAVEAEEAVGMRWRYPGSRSTIGDVAVLSRVVAERQPLLLTVLGEEGVKPASADTPLDPADEVVMLALRDQLDLVRSHLNGAGWIELTGGAEGQESEEVE